MKTAVAALLLAVSAAAPAQDVEAERRRIRDESAQVNAAYEAERKACYGRFAVNDCLDGARQRRNAAVADLRRQDVLLNDAERTRRAAERQRDGDARRAAEPLVRASRATGAPPPKPAAGETVAPGGKPRAKAGFDAPKLDAAEAARNRQAFEARRRQAEAHKAQVLERNAQRGKPPAADLPVPP